MKSLLKKARENKKGFTLAELLVVVAIVGILVAISIPVFTAQLGKARRATNQANLRAAKAAAVAEYLTSDDTQGADKFYKYNISAGNIESTDTKQILTDPQEITSLDDKAISSSKVYTDIVVEVTSTATAGIAEGTTSGVSNETVKLFVK